MKKKKFNIWCGAVLLVMMLAICYVAIDAFYQNPPPTLPEEYTRTVLNPSSG